MSYLSAFFKAFLTKKFMAKIAVEILWRIVQSTKNPVDDKAIKPVIDAIKQEYGVDDQ